MTIAVDFDGVIHAYSRGWHDGTIYDGPLPGALNGLRTLMDHAAVFIHTTRKPYPVAQWLEAHGIPASIELDTGDTLREFWNDQTQVLVTNRKLPAVAYLDDRAVRFTSWDHAVDETLLAAGLHPNPATATTTVARETERRRQDRIADSVARHTKELLARRTTTLRERAERAEADRDGASARLDRIAHAHVKHVDASGGTTGDCVECGETWPCPTSIWATSDRNPLATWDPADDEPCDTHPSAPVIAGMCGGCTAYPTDMITTTKEN